MEILMFVNCIKELMETVADVVFFSCLLFVSFMISYYYINVFIRNKQRQTMVCVTYDVKGIVSVPVH